MLHALLEQVSFVYGLKEKVNSISVLHTVYRMEEFIYKFDCVRSIKAQLLNDTRRASSTMIFFMLVILLQYLNSYCIIIAADFDIESYIRQSFTFRPPAPRRSPCRESGTPWPQSGRRDCHSRCSRRTCSSWAKSRSWLHSGSRSISADRWRSTTCRSPLR